MCLVVTQSSGLLVDDVVDLLKTKHRYINCEASRSASSVFAISCLGHLSLDVGQLFFSIV